MEVRSHRESGRDGLLCRPLRPVVRRLHEADRRDSAQPRGSRRRSRNAERRCDGPTADLLLSELLEQVQVAAYLRDVEGGGIREGKTSPWCARR